MSRFHQKSRLVLSAIALTAFLNVTHPQTLYATDASSHLADVVEEKKLLEAVVNISARYNPKKDPKKGGKGKGDLDLETFGLPPQLEELLKHFGGGGMPGRGRRSSKMSSLGSGFIISANDKEATIITNNHVIEDTNDITITLNNPESRNKLAESKFKAKIIGRDPKTDIAVLKIDPKGKKLRTVVFGDSGKLRIGENVFAIGNPYGMLGGTVTRGIVSSLHRNIGVGPYDNFIQTDASITRGHSGGPLFNMHGEVIGVNTVIATGSGGSEGFGFSAPSSAVKNVVDQILKEGSVKRGWIGVAIAGIDEETAKTLGLKKAKGALVHSVDPKGPSKPAGVEPGDLILSFNGKEIVGSDSLPKIVATTPIGKEADMIVLRRDDAGKMKEVKLKVKVKLLKDKPEDALKGMNESEEKEGNKAKVESLGIHVQELDKTLREKLDLKDKKVDGLVITSVRGLMARAKGLTIGDIITKVNGMKVKGATDFEKMVSKAQKDRKAVILTIRHKDQTQVVALTPEEHIEEEVGK